MYRASAAGDVILRADAFCRPSEAAFSREDGNPKKKHLHWAQKDDIIALYGNDENVLGSEMLI